MCCAMLELPPSENGKSARVDQDSKDCAHCNGSGSRAYWRATAVCIEAYIRVEEASKAKFAVCRGVAQLGRALALGARGPQVQILSPRPSCARGLTDKAAAF